MKPDSMDIVFLALASATRRRMLDIIRSMPGCSVNDVVKYFGGISRIAVLKHLNVLERANLLTSRKSGRVRELYFNAVPIQLIYDRWTTEYSKIWASHATKIKFRAEKAFESSDQEQSRRNRRLASRENRGKGRRKK